ncbi:MAG: hypothetical protein RLO38_14885 [Roseovarius confluentis]|uniref:hypothetical protein n=1 Tax=Roseovarius sp. TaxID=1486281 RepID=UPI0032EF1B7D
MWSLVFRLALMASALLVAWNFARAWLGTLSAPKKTRQLPPQSPSEIAARVLAEEATRHVTAIEVAIAGLADEELWAATEAFTGAVNRLRAAMLAEPAHYRRAKRHFGQILIAAEQTVRHFARHYTATPDPGTRRRFLDLLGELTEAFDRAVGHYASAGAAELELEAETLKDLLRRTRH